MKTCERCGADTVDAQGICTSCGWQAPADLYEDDDSPSLGETRAADVPTSGGTPDARYAQAPRFARTAEMPRSGQPSRVSGPPGGDALGTSAGTARYCGTCGARIATGEAFCGQCGTPVGTSGGDFGTVNMGVGPASRYQIGGTGWTAGGGDAPTEEYAAPLGNGYPRTQAGMPYTPPMYASGPNQPAGGAAGDGSGRTVRIVFGVLCLAGSIASAITAVILAIPSGK
ncbi:MAG: zinc-ribbon domain-containing protein [Ktedonobacterales bacterium]